MINEVVRRRGYSLHGYPIVWIKLARKKLAAVHGELWLDLDDEEQKALIHEECMSKLRGEETKDTNIRNPLGKVEVIGNNTGGIPWEVTADGRQIRLTLEGRELYLSDLAGVAKHLKRAIVRKKIRDRETIKTLAELIEIERQSTKLILEHFDSLGG